MPLQKSVEFCIPFEIVDDSLKTKHECVLYFNYYKRTKQWCKNICNKICRNHIYIYFHMKMYFELLV